jgi:hypothetical protein
MDLQLELHVYSYVTLTAVHQDMSAIMKLIFERMHSPEERELAALVASKGGEKSIIADDATLGDVLSKSKPRSARMVKQKQDGDDADLTPSTLRKEMEKDPDEVIREDAKAFDQKFAAVLAQLEEVKQAVRRESDRVIAFMQNGPHERIVDRVCFLRRERSLPASDALWQDLYHMWKEMVRRCARYIVCCQLDLGLEGQRQSTSSRNGDARPLRRSQPKGGRRASGGSREDWPLPRRIT